MVEGWMSQVARGLRRGSTVALSAVALLFFAAGIEAAAQNCGRQSGCGLKQQIIDSLRDDVKTRGLTQDPARDAEAQRAIDELPKTRSLTVTERARVERVSQDKPSIDLEILFGYDSATPTREARETLASLGEALNDSELKGSTFLIAGHTDAKGSASYNQKLSQRRAEAVKKVLVSEFKIPADSLLTAGYGKDRLKDPANPLAAENRRVQVVNMGSVKTAGK
jgi:outer membrane protein OmpA-like peptidoglycan-associated protein